jgi:hypothetical protein
MRDWKEGTCYDKQDHYKKNNITQQEILKQGQDDMGEAYRYAITAAGRKTHKRANYEDTVNSYEFTINTYEFNTNS